MIHLLRRLLTTFILLLAAATANAAAAADENALWRAVKSGGHVVLVRHASAPGTGDPANFRLGDCATQRNLDPAGRDQAQRIGARFRENGIAAAQVFASQWCRTTETAKLLDLGGIEPLPALNSFFQQGDEAAQNRALRLWLAKRDLSQPTVLVTHQVNITALTGAQPDSGEMVVVRRGAKGELEVVGTLTADRRD